jgi:hypothetical protein
MLIDTPGPEGSAVVSAPLSMFRDDAELQAD